MQEGKAKQRLDSLLVQQGLCDSREQAKRLILEGEVLCGEEVMCKPSLKVHRDAVFNIKQKQRFVSRAGLKLEKALEAFRVDVSGLHCLDCGASTGGFTDCLLQRGASCVCAIDVGVNQLVEKLRQDPRVVVREKCNARYLTLDDIGDSVDLCVVDVSFISLTKILPALFNVLKPLGQIVCLIKPQFELNKGDLNKAGVVRDTRLHQQAQDKIKQFVVEQLQRHWVGCVDSPITGVSGNREFLALLQ